MFIRKKFKNKTFEIDASCTINPKQSCYPFGIYLFPLLGFHILVNSKYSYKSGFVAAFLFFQFNILYTRVKNQEL